MKKFFKKVLRLLRLDVILTDFAKKILGGLNKLLSKVCKTLERCLHRLEHYRNEIKVAFSKKIEISKEIEILTETEISKQIQISGETKTTSSQEDFETLEALEMIDSILPKDENA